MRSGAAIFIFGATVAWAVLCYITVHAVQTMGLAALMDSFNGGFADPWRAQFNIDLIIYLLLAAAWMVWRAHSRWTGIVFALLAVNLGSLFILPVLVFAVIRTGSVKGAVLGRHAQIH